MTTLYHASGACSLAPHLGLAWIGAQRGAVKARFVRPELLAVNPAGAVPTLREDDGGPLTQAGQQVLHDRRAAGETVRRVLAQESAR